MAMKKALLFVALLMLAGCVTIPASIHGSSATPQQDLVSVMNAPERYTGQEARFGGKVVKVINRTGTTRLEIAAMRLDSAARPLPGTPALGRIYADVNVFLDPVDFENQMVTVVGPVTGVEKGQVGQAQYQFVTIKVNGFQRWRQIQQVVMPPQPLDPWFFYGPTYVPRHGGYWLMPPPGFYPTAPAQVKTILTE
ncbi:MAG: Outer membrane protein slp [Candidatus Erwinia impunctatus]|nr:Outer membrane protein slp [Culicoides impunctatus]